MDKVESDEDVRMVPMLRVLELVTSTFREVATDLFDALVLYEGTVCKTFAAQLQ